MRAVLAAALLLLTLAPLAPAQGASLPAIDLCYRCLCVDFMDPYVCVVEGCDTESGSEAYCFVTVCGTIHCVTVLRAHCPGYCPLDFDAVGPGLRRAAALP